MKILVTGGSGFVGWHVVREAADAGNDIVSLSRGVKPRAHSYPIRNVKIDLVRPHGLIDALRGVDAVVHAAGTLREEATQSFERAHVGATANLIDACEAAGVGKIVYLSALGAKAGSAAPYLATKWEAEKLLEGSSIPTTIFRPSLIFGAGDRLVSHLLSLARMSPLIPVVGTHGSLIQPIWVGDVATAVVRSLGDEGTNGNVYELGGPAAMTFDALVDAVKEATGKTTLSLRLPDFLTEPFLRLGERLFDDPPLTPEQLELLSCGGTCDPNPAAVTFGLRMRSLADVLPEYRSAA